MSTDTTAGSCPMPDEVCADCGYRCENALPEELADAGKWGRAIWQRVKDKIDAR
jgi:hypothetical protein